jgi:hypothetical protein
MHSPVGPQPVAGQWAPSWAYDERNRQQAQHARRVQTTVDEESIIMGGVGGLCCIRYVRVVGVLTAVSICSDGDENGRTNIMGTMLLLEI